MCHGLRVRGAHAVTCLCITELGRTVIVFGRIGLLLVVAVIADSATAWLLHEHKPALLARIRLASLHHHQTQQARTHAGRRLMLAPSNVAPRNGGAPVPPEVAPLACRAAGPDH